MGTQGELEKNRIKWRKRTKGVLQQGATREEILETLQVVISIRGTTGVGESLRVVQFLEELGELGPDPSQG